MIIPNIWENKKCSKPPTRYGFDGDLSGCPMISHALRMLQALTCNKRKGGEKNLDVAVVNPKGL